MNACCILKRPFALVGPFTCPHCGETTVPMTQDEFRSALQAVSGRSLEGATNASAIDDDGRLRAGVGREVLTRMRLVIDAALEGHCDNTLMPCCVDLDSHHCCHVCNEVGAMIRAYEAEQ